MGFKWLKTVRAVAEEVRLPQRLPCTDAVILYSFFGADFFWEFVRFC